MNILDQLNSGFLTSKGNTTITSATGSIANATQANSSYYTSKGISPNTSPTGSRAGVSQAGASFYTAKGTSSNGAGQPNYLQTKFTNTVK